MRMVKSSPNCRNTVAKFGDRCKLCVSLNSGASLSNNMLPEDSLWIAPSRPMADRKSSSRSSEGTTGRSTRTALFGKK
ncbi:hypothetical protein B0T17DRAFT_614508 [Bombardia bombarda]|uniref:Uncharacterized protein n=1 Tax=Bombardia bombarda TaxID=252184 RepID=A0AA40C814_9PEZI|nr:hypothetical protein B0T17DRAFT_614508 [Bombardia bombarda]